MSTVSFSSSHRNTLSSSEHEYDEEGPCSDGGKIAGYKYLSSESSHGSIDIDGESEINMSQDDECVIDKISASFILTAGATDSQARQRIYLQPQKHASLVREDPTISETSWTDEKHNKYLNSIEEAFVKRLYQRRWEAEGTTTSSLSSKRLFEDVEPRISCDHQPYNLFPEANGTKAQMPWNHENIQNRTKRFRLESICIRQSLQEEDRNGRANNCKSVKEPEPEKGTTETGDVTKESSPKTRLRCFKDTSTHDRGRNTEISQRYMQEDQVVPSPSMENTSHNSS